MPKVTREFLGWDRPLVELVAEKLMAGARRDGGVIDLSDTLVVVPTRHSGRRLREALAVACARGGDGGLLPPRVVPPEAFLLPDPDSAVAGKAATLLAWTEVLRGAELGHYRALFPVDPVEQNMAWALGIAETIERARGVLAEGGKSIRDAVDVLPDGARWEDMAALERLVVARLGARGLRDAQQAKLSGATGAGLSDGISRIIVAAVPDMVTLAERALRASDDVSVWIYADASLAGSFSAWGRPLAERWAAREVTVPEFARRVHLAPNPQGQADAVVRVLRTKPALPRRRVALGTADAEVAGPLVRTLADVGVTVFDPEGKPLASGQAFAVLATVGDLLADGRWPAFRELLRQPAFLDGLARRWNPVDPEQPFGRVRVLAAFDTLYDARLCSDFAAVRWAVANPADARERQHRAGEMGFVVREVGQILASFESGSLVGAVANLLGYIAADPDEAERIAALAEEVGAFASPATGSYRAADLVGLMVRLLGGERTYADERGDVDLLGWLELAYEDAPDLVVAGFNDGSVPDSVVGDPFLPERAREMLGLRSNAERMARDAYLLESLVRARGGAGELHLVLGKVGQDGSPLKPSRLLFLCGDGQLPDRTLRLFGDADKTAASTVPARDLTWLLRPESALPPVSATFPRLSVTKFRDFLACPFRFYLRHGLRMEARDPEKVELEARDFGNVVHLALEALGDHGWARSSDSSGELEALLAAALDEVVESRYGKRPPIPLVLQARIAQERLRKVARCQADCAAEGWVIEKVEHGIGGEEAPWMIGGLPVTGTIDRIERHADGRVRLLDYKTSAKATDPAAAHVTFFSSQGKRGAEDFPDWQIVDLPDGRVARWTNLQLPLYCLWAREHYPDATRLECGYFNVPMTLGDTGISCWQQGGADSVLASALRCAEAIADEVRAGRFWPPAGKVTHDDFGGLALGGTLEESVDAESWLAAFAGAAQQPT